MKPLLIKWIERTQQFECSMYLMATLRPQSVCARVRECALHTHCRTWPVLNSCIWKPLFIYM